MTAFENKIKKARKEHKCIWCGEQILAKELYCRCTGVSDGDFYSLPFHKECSEAYFRDDLASEEGFSYYENPRGMTELEFEEKESVV